MLNPVTEQSMEPMHGKFEVREFDGEGDFALWKHKILAQMEIMGLADALMPAYEAEILSDIEGSDREETTVAEKFAAAMREPRWHDKNRRAKNLLSMSLADSVLRKVVKEKNAYDMWMALENEYQVKTLPHRFNLKQRFYSFKMDEGKNLDKNLDDFNKLISDLESVHVEMSDEDRAAILMNSLPKQFESMVHTMKYSCGRDTITVKEIISSAYSIEMELKEKGVYKLKSEVEGLFIQDRGRAEKRPQSKGKQYTKSRSKSKGKSRECWFCGVEGHFKQNCPKRKNTKKPVNVEQGEASVAQEQSREPLMLVASVKTSKEEWVLDSACSYHITFRKDVMFDISDVDGGKVLMGNDTSCQVTAIGKVQLTNKDGSVIVLTQVRYCPTSRRNLISLGQLETLGCWFQSKDFKMKIFYEDKVVMTGDYKDTIYILNGNAQLAEANVSEGVAVTADLWHARMGHGSAKGLQILGREGLIDYKTDKEYKLCEHCIMGKAHRASFKRGMHTSTEPLEYVHSDLWGASTVTPSLAKHQYYMSFVDDYSRKVWVSFLRTKDEAFTKFVEWKELTENQSGKKLKALRTDNGLEYCNKDFEDYCKKHGVLRHKTCPYTPQQNGIAERLNRTILEKVRSLLSETGLGERFWAETTSTVVYMINRTPSKPLNFKIPEEVWSGRRPQYSHMRRFGCLAYYHVSQGKLKPRAKKGVFLGYPQGVKGYRIWSLEDRKCVITRDVIFCEDTVYKDIGKVQEAVSQTEKAKKKKKVSFILPNDHGSDDRAGTSTEIVDDGGAVTENEIPEEEEVTVEYEADDSVTADDSYLLARDRERRVIRKPSRFVDNSIACYAMNYTLIIEE